ncbi:MAG: hypothetical protein J6K89_01620 [Oscillospiraceae bacterium]|nr:hypothetical protein [Oscillospiraceae bacterium]
MNRRNLSSSFILIILLILLIIPVSAYTGNGGTTVYVTETGGRYHASNCGSLWSSKISIKLEDAIIDGYTRCDRCNPPVYTGTAKPGETREVHSGGDSNTTRNTITDSKNDSSAVAPQRGSNSNKLAIVSKQICLFIFLYIPCGLILCSVVYNTGTSFLAKTTLYKKLLLKRRKKQLYEDVSIFLLRYQKYMEFRSSPQYAALCKIHKDKSSRLKLLLSAHDCEFGEDGKLRNINSVIGYGKDFTIYRGSSCYHSHNCQYAVGLYIHLLERSYRLRPCSKCCPPIQKPWMQECINLRKEISEIEHVIYFPLKEDKSTTKTPLSILQDLCRIQEKLHHQMSRKIR